jgi:DNA-binding transcriptional LysR family regulator
MPINELRSIQTFVKTAELGSLRRAAAAQGITPQAASQALAQLEQHLGVRLFQRTTRSLPLTDEGRQFLDAAQAPLLGLQRALQIPRRARDEIAGPLRIVGPRSTFRSVISSLLSEFCARHPEVQADVRLDDRIGNGVEDGADVGFGVGAAAADGAVAQRLFPLQLIVCAAPRYLERHGAPDSLADLSVHRCSALRLAGTGRAMPWQVRDEGAVVDLDVVPTFCSNDEALEVDAILSGDVIGQLSGVSAAAHIRAGRLVPLLTRHVADHLAMHVHHGSRDARPSRVRAFVDLAIERLADSRDFVLSFKELAAAEARGRKASGRRVGPPSRRPSAA